MEMSLKVSKMPKQDTIPAESIVPAVPAKTAIKQPSPFPPEVPPKPIKRIRPVARLPREVRQQIPIRRTALIARIRSIKVALGQKQAADRNIILQKRLATLFRRLKEMG